MLDEEEREGLYLALIKKVESVSHDKDGDVIYLQDGTQSVRLVERIGNYELYADKNLHKKYLTVNDITIKPGDDVIVQKIACVPSTIFIHFLTNKLLDANVNKVVIDLDKEHGSVKIRTLKEPKSKRN